MRRAGNGVWWRVVRDDPTRPEPATKRHCWTGCVRGRSRMDLARAAASEARCSSRNSSCRTPCLRGRADGLAGARHTRRVAAPLPSKSGDAVVASHHDYPRPHACPPGNSLPPPAPDATAGSKSPPLVGLPGFCRVAATASPSSDSIIKIEVWMPAANWNGRFEGVGNGGWAGNISYGSLASGKVEVVFSRIYLVAVK